MSAFQTQVSGLGSDVHLKKLQALSITHVEQVSDNKDELSASALESEAESDAVPTSQGCDPVAVRSKKPTATSEELLSALGLGVEELSEAGRDDLRTIAAVSEQLGLITTEKAQVLAAVAELRQRQWTAEDTKAEITALRDNVASQIKIIRAKIEDLKEVTLGVDERQAAEAREHEEKQQRKLRFEVKSQNYVEELLQLEAKLKRTGFVPELSHDSLSGRSARLAEEQEAVVALKKKLSFYRDLPPDIDAANQVFAAKLQQMQAATKQFEEGLAQL